MLGWDTSPENPVHLPHLASLEPVPLHREHRLLAPDPGDPTPVELRQQVRHVAGDDLDEAVRLRLGVRVRGALGDRQLGLFDVASALLRERPDEGAGVLLGLLVHLLGEVLAFSTHGMGRTRVGARRHRSDVAR